MTGSAAPAGALPRGVVLLERGWLSSNSVVIRGSSDAAVVDTGYATHAAQTLELVRAALRGLPLATIANTHLHSDHCGGNSALQQAFPDAKTLIPPGSAAAVKAWDVEALTYKPTGQVCPRFDFQGTLVPGGEVMLGDLAWQVHAAPGHDPHSVVLFEPEFRCLLSADALWENGFGVVFPELEGEHAFSDVGKTLDLIEDLAPTVVLPGHGSAFTDVEGALERARSRLQAYVESPARHAAHASKVLLKFKLLELQEVGIADFVAWAAKTAYFSMVHRRWFGAADLEAWITSLIQELVRSKVAHIDGNRLQNA